MNQIVRGMLVSSYFHAGLADQGTLNKAFQPNFGRVQVS